MVRNILHLYAGINNGDYQQAVHDFATQVEEESKNIISEMIDTPILLGVSMSSVMSKSIEDIIFISTLIFWAIFGKDYKEMWTEPELSMEDDGTVRLTLQQKFCLFCAEESKLTHEHFGIFTPGEVLAAIFKGILQALQDYVGNEYNVIARETKCFVRGDPHGEITILLKPREQDLQEE